MVNPAAKTALPVAESRPAPAVAANPPTPPGKGKSGTDIIQSSYQAADSLIVQLQHVLPQDTPLIAATLVNLNRLDESSPLGRLVTEQISGRFAQHGYRAIEVKLRNQIYMKRNEGELVLTREVVDLAKKHSASAVVSGTYADSEDRVFINLKVVQIKGNVILGAVDYVLAKDPLVRSLLPKSANAESTEKTLSQELKNSSFFR